jgi:peptide deformylase
MPIRPIVFSDDPLLRKKSRRVQRVSPDTQQLIDDMVETMHAASGIGLAAVQVGVPERVIVVQLPLVKDPEQDPDDEAPPGRDELHVVINPQLARRSREVEDGIEGCLSIPGWVGEVSRHSDVTVKGLDHHGRRVRIKAHGLLARVFQHEIDHCDGTLFTDRIEDPDKIWPVEEGQEEAAEAAQEVPDGIPVPGSPVDPV